MRKLYTSVFLASAVFLTGCNGKSGENEAPPVDGPVVELSAISIAIQNAQGDTQVSFEQGESATVIATLTDTNGALVTNTTVTFSTSFGQLSQDSKLTNSEGQATITLTNPEALAGAGSIAATAGALEPSTIDFEYLVSTESEEALPSLSLSLSLNGEQVNNFKSDETVQLISTLVDGQGQPISGEIITYTADIGALTPNTALTNAQGIAIVTLAGNDQTGAGIVTASYGETDVIASSRMNYQVIASDETILDDVIRIGYFDDNGDFIEGAIELSIDGNIVSAGGTLGLSVDLVDSEDAPVTIPTSVSFSSNCVASGNATIEETVFSIQGKAKATYEDIDCAGLNGIDDVILASVSLNGVTNVAQAVISITGEELGSIEFLSAAPETIVLKGTGGQGNQETSTLTFQVKSSLGNPLAQQDVEFILDTTAGGIVVNPVIGVTNSQGIVTTKVTAGSVPTAVRVTAKAVAEDGSTIQTQSDLLSINTGLPEQRSFTLSTAVRNPEAGSINGVDVDITAQLADNFNNPVPDGTTVNFTTEGGVIEPSCLTVNGACSVTWTSAEPRVADHRITILATALGHETFFDTNGNNIFDDADGSAVTEAFISAGFSRITPRADGFVDMTEAWRDDNENGLFDAGETFLDFNNDGSFSIEDGLFNGPQCEGSSCGAQGNQAIHVRRALVMVMASSTALFTLTDENGVNYPTGGTETVVDTLSFTLDFSDTASQAMPFGTTVTVEASAGTVEGTTNFTVPDTLEPHSIEFVIVNPPLDDPAIGTLTITITSPSGVETTIVQTLDLP
ncbi:Ig-like domain-containing protein [Thalassotalea sp. LPB0316]|uniref:Ig-like domain-containing protein n=1 Tax=Thalassotalea sp. LPB0316 TaxID=2769490 RepID=UPI0018685600|nr:Ig-like domain-containing protein [Thalassotalea sp. LPB0316]QOL24672.1 Ig-like domain-containing protein [Thalassotalea sp. LPB0316]